MLLSGFSILHLSLWVRPGAGPRVEHLMGLTRVGVGAGLIKTLRKAGKDCQEETL